MIADMLASNLHQFRVDVRTSVTLEADRERCRQLLANVEFVQVITAPASSQLYSRLYQVMTWLVLAWFPIATLIAVQISSLRFQSTTATTTQQICVAFDLLIIFWFINRQREREITSEKTFSQRSLYSLIYLLITAILVFDFIYLNVPDADELTVRRDDGSRNWSLAYQQPIDFALCRPSLQWGCRYLTIDHRTLVGKLWKPDLIAELITFPEDISKALALVEGVYLRDRELRFAKLDESRLYAADLRGADLRGATLVDTHLQGAKLDTANLVGANLTFADLRGARLTGANLTETVLKQAILESTYLTEANLARANLTGAKVIRARLYKAVIIDADLTGADLTGAYLLEANLQNANLTGANVTGATFIEGNLTGADLTRADLTGADLSGTNLDR